MNDLDGVDSDGRGKLEPKVIHARFPLVPTVW